MLVASGRSVLTRAREACAALGRAGRRLLALRSRRRFGIVAHLVVAFLAVGALAIAANLFAEHGTVFVEPAPPPVERIVYVPVQAQPLVAPQPALPAPLAALDTTRIRAAVDELERAALQRVDDSREAAEQALLTAADHLRGEANVFARLAGSRIPRNRLAQLESDSARLAELALENRRLADAQRRLSSEHRRHFESMESRMAASLEKAWRIFGRVIARESLVELDQRLADIGRQLATLDEEAGAGAGQLQSSEAAFRETLEKKAASLASSQGDLWVAEMRADFERLVATRESFAVTRQALQAGLATFSGTHAALGASIAAMAAKSASPSRRATARAAAGPADKHLAPAEEPRLEPVTPSRASLGEAVAPVTPVPVAEPAKSRILAWISVAVLLVLLVVSTLMAMRVIGPVRSLVAATRRLADGRLDARAAGGGIRELDELGACFNDMAQRLADSRTVTEDYQRLLETRVRERTRQLQHLAEHDPLTELPNRRQLFSQLTAALADADPGSDVVGVLVLDLDNFKNINDTMGHAYGDRVLQEVAKRLDSVVAQRGFSARQGGDEFTIVCCAAKQVDDVIAVAQRILDAFQQPLDVDGRGLGISVSIGIAAYPAHAPDADALLRAADAALFRAKALGRHRLSVFSTELLDAAASRFRTEQGLRQAIERGEFELAFQPEVQADTFGVPLVEALLRWRLPDGRLASPGDFLEVAEDSGLIVEISDWVLRSAIAAAAEWRRNGWRDLRVAVNVSPRQVAAPGFAERLLGLVEAAGLPPGNIEIELTEHVLQTGEATIDTLRTLRSHGIGIALDDFGTGYSTLASLEQLPFTRVKLDRSLVARIDTVERSLAIAQTIIDLCRRLGLEVTAEGVERVEQLDILARAPGIHVQGYLLSRPLSVDRLRPEIEALPARMQTLLLATEIQASTPSAVAARSCDSAPAWPSPGQNPRRRIRGRS